MFSGYSSRYCDMYGLWGYTDLSYCAENDYDTLEQEVRNNDWERERGEREKEKERERYFLNDKYDFRKNVSPAKKYSY